MIIFDKLFSKSTHHRPKYKEWCVGVIGNKSLCSFGVYDIDDKGCGLNFTCGKNKPTVYLSLQAWNKVLFIALLDEFD